MKVILKHDVKGLGREGDLKEVKDGYARNFLLPTGKAIVADKGSLANWDRHREQRDERDRAERVAAEATADRLRELKLEIPVKAGERGRLFGAVTSHQIATDTPCICASRSRRSATTGSTSASCPASMPWLR
jgi:large subunit ribosomal protein L9